MQIQFVGKNLEVTPALKDYTIEKFGSLEKRFNNISKVNIVFHVEHDSQIVEATVHHDGAEVHARAEDADMYKSILLVIDKLLGQMTKHKEKIIDSHR